MADTFIDKLISVQSELKAPKNQKNTFGNYNYRSCEDILEAVKPLLKKYGLLLTVSDEIVQVGDRFYVKATALVTDGSNSSTASAYAREPLSAKGMSDSQNTGTASSYARKYCVGGLFLIDDNKDPDTNEYVNTTKKTEEKKSAKSESTTECIICNKPIEAFTGIGKDGTQKTYTVEHLIAISKAKYGLPMCYACMVAKTNNKEEQK